MTGYDNKSFTKRRLSNILSAVVSFGINDVIQICAAYCTWMLTPLNLKLLQQNWVSTFKYIENRLWFMLIGAIARCSLSSSFIWWPFKRGETNWGCICFQEIFNTVIFRLYVHVEVSTWVSTWITWACLWCLSVSVCLVSGDKHIKFYASAGAPFFLSLNCSRSCSGLCC